MNSKFNYAEFDDVVRLGISGTYVTSEKAVAEMHALARKHSCTFDANPGGAEFNGTVDGRPFRCQIHDHDDIENLGLLRMAVGKCHG